MSALLRQRPRYNVAAFVELIRPYPDEERWELLDGEPVLMAPQSERHQRIVGNLSDHVRSLARRKGCIALPGLGLLNDRINDYAPIPDIVVRCGPPLDGGYATDPVFVAEVLSPSTMGNDRGRKLEFFQTIASLETILIVYQDELRVEAWHCGGGEWRLDVHRTRSSEVKALGGTILLADLYEDVPLAE